MNNNQNETITLQNTLDSNNEPAVLAVEKHAPVTTLENTRRSRGANPAQDNLWTRHHAICMMGVVCDQALGGYEAARISTAPLKEGVRPAAVADVLLNLTPWLLNKNYLNFAGSSGLEKHGLPRFFKNWVTNRVYYFYRFPERSEHPERRAKGNLRAVYKEFYDTFSAYVAEKKTISESDAEAFWTKVSDRVPFKTPV